LLLRAIISAKYSEDTGCRSVWTSTVGFGGLG